MKWSNDCGWANANTAVGQIITFDEFHFFKNKKNEQVISNSLLVLFYTKAINFSLPLSAYVMRFYKSLPQTKGDFILLFTKEV